MWREVRRRLSTHELPEQLVHSLRMRSEVAGVHNGVGRLAWTLEESRRFCKRQLEYYEITAEVQAWRPTVAVTPSTDELTGKRRVLSKCRVHLYVVFFSTGCSSTFFPHVFVRKSSEINRPVSYLKIRPCSVNTASAAPLNQHTRFGPTQELM